MSAEYPDPDTFKADFHRRLKATRNELGLTQNEMAATLKVSPSIYPKLENRDHPPLWLLPRLIAETDKPYSYWCLGIEPRPKGKSTAGLRLVKR